MTEFISIPNPSHSQCFSIDQFNKISGCSSLELSLDTNFTNINKCKTIW